MHHRVTVLNTKQNIATLRPMQAVRDMCVQDQCRAYGKNWTCPPIAELWGNAEKE